MLAVKRRITDRILLSLLTLALAHGSPLRPQTSGRMRPPEIDPNAIQDPSRPMTIKVDGIPKGNIVHFQILRDCDRDYEPELSPLGGCQSPVIPGWDVKAGDNNDVTYEFDFKVPAHSVLPEEIPLWVHASRRGSSSGTYVRFSLTKNPCSLWQDISGSFFGGKCSLGLVQALRRHLGPPGFEGITFEVRRLDPSSTSLISIPVAGTRGATGVSWLDTKTLVVAVARDAGTSLLARSALLRIPIDGGAPSVLWALPGTDSREPTAPFRLPDGRIAFVLQEPGEALDGGDNPALLSLWKDGKVDAATDVVLPYKVHQILASDSTGQSLLALSLGVGANRPVILNIDLQTRTVTPVGFHDVLYQSALRSPSGKTSVIAFEDNSGQTGWDLVLVDGEGKLLEDLQTRPQDDLLPAWRPDGGEIAFLAEVGR